MSGHGNTSKSHSGASGIPITGQPLTGLSSGEEENPMSPATASPPSTEFGPPSTQQPSTFHPPTSPLPSPIQNNCRSRASEDLRDGKNLVNEHRSLEQNEGSLESNMQKASSRDIALTWGPGYIALLLSVISNLAYLCFLLGFPALYWSRATRIFQDANLGMGEIKRVGLELVYPEAVTERAVLYPGATI